MDMEQKKQIDRFQKEYDDTFAKPTWDAHDVTLMKDLQKLMYYIEVRSAMKEGSDSSYRGRMRNPTNGQYISRGSGMYPTGGHRYYDGEKDDAINRLMRLMETETNPEARMAIQMAIRELEA